MAAQQPPIGTLQSIWGGDATINQVTVRQLLQMRSGLKDYNDAQLFEWTLNNQDKVSYVCVWGV